MREILVSLLIALYWRSADSFI